MPIVSMFKSVLAWATALVILSLVPVANDVFAALERPDSCEAHQREGYDWETETYPEGALCRVTGDIEVIAVDYDVVTPHEIYGGDEYRNFYNEQFRTSNECIIERISVQIDQASMQLALNEGAIAYADHYGPELLHQSPQIITTEFLGSKGSYSGERALGDKIYLTANRENVNLNTEHHEGVEPLTESESAFLSEVDAHVDQYFGVVDYRSSNDKAAYANAYALRSSTFQMPDTSIYPAEYALCVARQVNKEAKRQQIAAEARLARLHAIEQEIEALQAETQAIIDDTNAKAQQIQDFLDFAISRWIDGIRAWLQGLATRFVD